MLAVALVEVGALLAELRRRRGHSVWRLENVVAECQGGLVNLFDLGIVLSVAFLLAAPSSL